MPFIFCIMIVIVAFGCFVKSESILEHPRAAHNIQSIPEHPDHPTASHSIQSIPANIFSHTFLSTPHIVHLLELCLYVHWTAQSCSISHLNSFPPLGLRLGHSSLSLSSLIFPGIYSDCLFQALYFLALTVPLGFFLF